VHAPTKDKCDDTKDNLYEELQHVFEQISEIPHVDFVRRFQCKGREGIYFQTNSSE
jgi:hypothetical protein